MRTGNEIAGLQPGGNTSQILPCDINAADVVGTARRRLRDCIIALGLPYHQGIALFAAADAYAKAMRNEVRK